VTEPPQVMTLTPREMALGVWIDNLSERVAKDDRSKVHMLFATAELLAIADKFGEVPKLTKEEERFLLTVKQGCEARGAKRGEAAAACIAVALLAVKQVMGEVP